MSAPFPHAVFAGTWDTCIAALEADATLSAGVTTFQLWDGSSDILRTPSADDLPWLCVSAAITGYQWIDELSQHAQITFAHEMGTAGTDWRDFASMWEAIIHAWFPGDNVLLNELQAFRGWQKTVKGPAAKPVYFGEKQGLRGVSYVVVDLDITT